MRLDHLLSKENKYLKRFYCLFFSVLFCTLNYGDVAQLARAPALQAGGQEFDSPHLHHHRNQRSDVGRQKTDDFYKSVKRMFYI